MSEPQRNPDESAQELDSVLIDFIDECIVELIVRSLQQRTDEQEER